jgi:hypothetical protein
MAYTRHYKQNIFHRNFWKRFAYKKWPNFCLCKVLFMRKTFVYIDNSFSFFLLTKSHHLVYYRSGKRLFHYLAGCIHWPLAIRRRMTPSRLTMKEVQCSRKYRRGESAKVEVTIILQFINDQTCFNDFFAYPRTSRTIKLLPAPSLRMVPFV